MTLRAPALNRASLGLIVLAALGFGLVLSLEYARKVRVAAYLEPRGGMIELVADASGRVQAVHVSEGSVVESGQVLMALGHDRHGESGQPLRKREAEFLVAARLRLNQRTSADLARQASQLRALEDELDHLQGESVALTRELRLAEEQVALLRRAEARSGSLLADAVVARAEHERNRRNTLDAVLGESRIRRALAANQRQLAQAREARLRLPREHRAHQLQLAQEQADLARQLARLGEQRQTSVIAPRDGVITFVQFSAGDQVTANQALMILTPAEATADLVLLADAAVAADIEVGGEVRFKALGASRRSNPVGAAIVRELSDTPQRPVQLRSWIPVQDAVFRARAEVTVLPEGLPLRHGMQVDAFVVTRSKTLWRWLLEPLTSALQKL